jgi:NADH-quinone oxidoreductase subunit L
MLEAAWLIPALPLAGFLVLTFFGRVLGEPRAGWLATAAMAGSFVTSIVVFLGLVDRDAEDRRFVQTLFEWVPAGDFSVDVGFLVDPLSVTMMLFVSGVGMLIHLYSIGYMHGDADFAKFFAYLNLFAFSMLMLVMGDNMLLTFLGWEGVGACSYFLISFWYTDEANASAGKKAFVTNRVGDWGFMVAMFLTFAAIGTVNYIDMFGNASLIGQSTATAITVLVFVGVAGKSAQIPLYLWLPDAMAGPTPVSALIHAATMVTGGVYLLTRLNPIIAESAAWGPSLIAWVGAATALFAATIALAQNDIKKVLAYSTISQLGYMVLAVGTGAYVAAIFHMVTHAFFKALLFLGAGSVIHGMDDDQDIRHYGGLYKLMPITAFTYIVGWLAIVGAPPFSGFWSKDEILAFAWDESVPLWVVGYITAILTALYMTRQVVMTFFGRYRFADTRAAEVMAVWNRRIESAEIVVADAQSAISVARGATAGLAEKLDGAEGQLAKRESEMANFDPTDAKAREKAGDKLDKARRAVTTARETLSAADAEIESSKVAVDTARVAAAEVVAAAEAAAPTEAVGLFEEPVFEGIDADELPPAVAARREYRPHESPWLMTLPLVVLAGAAVVAGLLNLPFTSDLHILERWLEPSLFGNEAHLGLSALTQWVLGVVAAIGGLIGIGAAVLIYRLGRRDPADIEKPIFADAWHYDRIVTDFMGGPGRKGFELVSWFDTTIIDGTVNGVGRVVRAGGGRLRRLQTGFVRSYAAGVGVGAVLLLLWFLSRATF